MIKSKNENGFGVVEIILIVLIVGLLGFIGWNVYQTRQKANVTQVNQPTKTAQIPPVKTNPNAEWKTYTSSFEGLSFKYPGSWQSVTPEVPSSDPSADSFEIKSPSGNLKVAWDSEVDGIGGACDDTIKPGANVGVDQLGPCPYWEVQHAQKLIGADLYYVDGVVTDDGTTYRPWCALQASDGIVKSQSNIGYLLYKAKKEGSAGLMCGRPFGGGDLTEGTKAQAIAAISNADFQQAKLILLSATY